MKKEDKIAILKGALKLLKQKEDYFICKACSHTYKVIYGKYINHSEIFGMIPELLKYKPKKPYADYSWWNVFINGSLRKRINVVKKTIKDLESN